MSSLKQKVELFLLSLQSIVGMHPTKLIKRYRRNNSEWNHSINYWIWNEPKSTTFRICIRLHSYDCYVIYRNHLSLVRHCIIVICGRQCRQHKWRHNYCQQSLLRPLFKSTHNIPFTAERYLNRVFVNETKHCIQFRRLVMLWCAFELMPNIVFYTQI